MHIPPEARTRASSGGINGFESDRENERKCGGVKIGSLSFGTSTPQVEGRCPIRWCLLFGGVTTWTADWLAEETRRFSSSPEPTGCPPPALWQGPCPPSPHLRRGLVH
ncbi:unnamed protein product [Gadus morhua 'NCC']